MALIDRQRRTRRIGKIRIGASVERQTAQGLKVLPTSLETFRFTCSSRQTADAVAELFGGQPRPWAPPGAGRSSEWEVLTAVAAIPVMVPPHEHIVESWYELWEGAKRTRRCDGNQVTLTGQLDKRPCLCPKDPDRRMAGAKANPPTACKTMTHFQVMIPHLPELGVWALDTASEYAADEAADTAELLERAAAAGVYLPAELYISRRNRISTGTSYPVPCLRTVVSLHDLAHGVLPAGDMRAAMALLPAPPRFKALAAGPATTEAHPGAPARTEAPRAVDEPDGVVDAEVVDDGDDAPLPEPPDDWAGPQVTAQDYADRAQKVVHGAGTPADVEAIRAEAERHGLLADPITIGGHPGKLADYLRWCSERLRTTA